MLKSCQVHHSCGTLSPCGFEYGSLVKPLLDAVVALPTDDSPLALAAAAVLYFLALDVSL
jgi:hypothetical protein